MLYFKDLLNKLYIKFSKSKFVKWLFPVFLLFLVPNVYAFSYNLNTATDFVSPTSFEYRVNSQDTYYINFQVGLSSWSANYDDILNLSFDLCATNNNFTIGRRYNLGSNCTNSCFAQNSVIVSTGQSCTTYGGSYLGQLFKVYMPINKLYINAGTTQDLYEVNDYVSLKNTSNWSAVYSLSNFTFNDNDLSVLIGNNSINSSINSMSDTIVSNQNTNTQNIINNQNTNAAQAHSDATNIKNSVDSIKNQDHTYNNIANDSPSGQSDITSSNNKETQLMQSIDLDSSILDVTLNTDATSWIWTIVTNLRAINGKITLLFVTVLSLGIIKMILNR